jgi:hypothetical protein
MANYKPTPLVQFLIAASCMFAVRTAIAEYVSEDMCIIPWGNGPGELKYYEPIIDYPPKDSGDGMPVNRFESEGGFIDNSENIYVAISYPSQFKGFGNDNHLIFDFSKENSNYPKGFMVDSLSRIYVHDPFKDYIAIIDTAGTIIDKITPFFVGSGARIERIYRNSNDVLTFNMGYEQYFGYSNHTILNYGSWGWLADDGYRYYATLENSHTVRYYRYDDPKINEEPKQTRKTDIPLKDSVSVFGQFLGMDDSLNLFIYIFIEELANNKVLVIDRSYSIVDEILIQHTEGKFGFFISPFMRPSDGNVYEFRCLEDGLQVVRWKRK